MMMDPQQQQQLQLQPQKAHHQTDQHQQHQQQQLQQQQQQQQQAGADGKLKRNPYCSRCRNHGKSAQVKGHKRHCEYRHCQCEGCKLVECRQIVSAAQIKRRRYQKQDEECGRRIEISPPVLTRAPLSDSATLIAKTLINSKGSQHSPSAGHFATTGAVGGATPTAAAMVAVSQHAHKQLRRHISSGIPAAFRGAVGPPTSAALSASSTASTAPTASTTSTTTLALAWPQHTPPSLSAGCGHLLPLTTTCQQHLLHLDTGHHNHNHHNHHHHHHHHTALRGHSQLGSMASRLGPPLALDGALVPPTSGAAPMTTSHHLAPSHLLDQTRTGCCGSPNLREALQLFHLHHPASMLSSAAYVHAGNGSPQLPPTHHPGARHPQPYTQLDCNSMPSTQQAGADTAGVGGSLTTQSKGTPSEPTPTSHLGPPTPASSSPTTHVPGHSTRDQLNLVKEIHRLFGPLVVFAWLRSERFNVAKVRALIDTAEESFDELLQVNGHSPLDLTSPIVD